MSLSIVMTTHKREPSYLTDTLKSFRDTCSEKLSLLVHERPISSPSPFSIVDDYPIKSIRFLTEEEEKEKNGLGQRVRVAHATRLALEMAEEDCLLLQDDIKFAPGWIPVLRDHVLSLGDARHNALIALYSHRNSDQKGLVRWDPKTYWGLLGMYFGREARLASLEGAFQTSGPNRMWPNDNGTTAPGADVRLQKFLLTNPKYTLYTIYPNLVQHTGKVSSINSKPGSRSPTFKEPRPPIHWPARPAGK